MADPDTAARHEWIRPSILAVPGTPRRCFWCKVPEFVGWQLTTPPCPGPPQPRLSRWRRFRVR